MSTLVPLKHLLVSREYPPSTYPKGGIGTYVEHIARLLVDRGETVHVIAELWDGAPLARQELHDGRLIVHRVPLGYPVESMTPSGEVESAARVLDAMAGSEFPAQSFSWQAALLIEALVQSDGIDVIEGQDYEAPLYYLLVRRALGLGPGVRPPCFVHLHSPWELVCHANDWGLASAYDVTIKRLEDYTIRAADAVLCPSEFLATQAEQHYALGAGVVERIPYPIGHTPYVERTAATWERGTICYFGRLEARKGVLEWIHAAIEVASQRPGLRFELIGADTSLTGARGTSMRRTLQARIPEHLSSSFTFTDALPRDALLTRLAEARCVVVPSRWENFPNTCVEAMCSGLPVLASPHGGMAEMIDDGRTGWLAASNRPGDLAAALVRALDTPPAVLAEMGRTASAEIRRQCDNETTLDRQLAFRRRLVEQGTGRSLTVPSMPVWAPPSSLASGSPTDGAVRGTDIGDARSTPPPRRGTGMCVVVLDNGSAGDREACLATVTAQTVQPASIVVVTREMGVGAVLDGSRGSLGVAIVDAGCRLHPTYVSACVSVLDRHPNVGVVSSWSEARDAVDIHPHPALPYQWVMSDVTACAAIRTSALECIEWVRDITEEIPQLDVLVAPILAEGWLAVTYPAVLSRRVRPVAPEIDALARAARARVRLAALTRYRERLEQDAPLLMHLAQAAGDADAAGGIPRQVGRGALSFGSVWRLSVGEQLALVSRAVRNPRYAANWLKRQGRGRRPPSE